MNHPTRGTDKPESARTLEDAVWPHCREAMHEAARTLIRRGLSEQSICKALLRDFPGLLFAAGPEWRRGARYANVIAAEQMRAYRARRIGREMAG